MIFASLRLAAELRRWRRAGRRATLWWRDDDARGASGALRRLLALADAQPTPVTLAAIPDADLRQLDPMLAGRPWVRVAQHGIDHQNRRGGPAAGEFPPDWTRDQIIERLAAGWSRLKASPQVLRVFTPPWNDVHPALPEALRASGYVGLSAWGEIAPAGRSFRVDAHIDLMRWRKGARFRGRARLQAALAEALRRRRRLGLWDAPIGLLTHHLDHDEAAWGFLEEFLVWSAERPEIAWRPLSQLLPAAA